jgi:hypothetical protein
MDKRVSAWLQSAIADAERRGLPELKPLLEGLAQSVTTLRTAHAAHEGPLGRPAASGEGRNERT